MASDQTVGLATTNRVEAFSDGVMAIAITLLILEIRVPASDDRSLLRSLADLWPSYLAYLASFFTIGIIWLNHHAFFTRLHHLDHVILWWNLMLLLGVSFLPFPTSVLARYIRSGGADASVAAGFYGLIGVLMTVPWVFLWRRLVRRPELLEPPFDAAFARAEGSRSWVGVVIYAVCIGVGVLSPVAALGLYLAVALFYAFTSQGWRPAPTD